MKQKIARIEQEYTKKEYDLRKRIDQKYKEKADKEYEKKHIQLMKRKQVKLHNLKVEMSDDKRLKKKSVVKQTGDYGNACILAQLKSKLMWTDEKGYGWCICCPGLGLFARSKLDGGHCFPKSQSRTIALDERNIHTQRKYCNGPLGGNGNQSRQEPQIERIHGFGTIKQLKEDMKTLDAPNPKQYIIENLTVVRQLFAEKKLEKKDHDNVERVIRKLENRYL